MSGLVTIGTCTEVRGAVARGRVDLFAQVLDPDDRSLALSVVIVSGKLPGGPTILVTANIHGDEVCPTIVSHRLIEHLEANLATLVGRVVVFPSLNPTGHLNMTRNPQFQADDPNRFWPDANPEAASNRLKASREEGDWLSDYSTVKAAQPKPIERCWTAVFELFKACAPDFHVDLHTICHLSIPFQFLDRVLFSEDKAADPPTGAAAGAAGSNKAEAEALFAKTHAMCAAIGLTIVMENSAARYVKKELHRSTSGAVLNVLRVPSVTLELGGNGVADPAARDGGLAGLRNLLVFAGCLDGAVAPVTCCTVVAPQALHRHLDYPFCPGPGVVDFVKKAGEAFEAGEELAVLRGVDGRRRGSIKAEFAGFVVAWRPGVARYGGEALGVCAAEDRLPCVASWESLKDKTDGAKPEGGKKGPEAAAAPTVE